MSFDQECCCRAFVNFAGLYTHQPVLEIVYPADSVSSSNQIEIFENFNWSHSFAIDGDWRTSVEFYLDIFRFCWGCLGRVSPLVGLWRRFSGWILKNSALNRSTPEILVHTVRVL